MIQDYYHLEQCFQTSACTESYIYRALHFLENPSVLLLIDYKERDIGIVLFIIIVYFQHHPTIK